MGQVWLIHSELSRFDESMHRCLADPSFLNRFYEHFIGESPEVAAKFKDTDLVRQTKMLEQSMKLVLKAANGLEEGREHLAKIAESHSERGFNIGAHLYQAWLKALVKVASETDPEWEESLSDTWYAALQPCIDRMVRA